MNQESWGRLAPSEYRGRLAPSPTGLLHAGHARTFWTAYQRSRDAGGVLVFRNENLDPYRSRPEYEQAMFEDLHWLGIRWQEGPDIGGPFGPYAQSQRLPLYHAAWRSLLQKGAIYPCQCSRKDLERSTQAPHEAANPEPDDEPVYPGTCRPDGRQPDHSIALPEQGADLSPAGVNWRFRVPDGEAVEFEDGYFGPQRFVAGRDFGDFLVWRRDDVPAYQLAVVVDDAAMRITEVVRGADLIKSTARQILLYRALGLPQPLWYHCPLVTDALGHRLAKRHDALALRTLRERGVTAGEIVAAGFSIAPEIAP
ncbi:MAG TPA: tRNA glutamyl-Q(34) synthetase GluQRS [Acidisarcina sp.]|nr:tRNA glutamyl-Q(34) synthetase GluQRS [Acidisarcina sp.]